MPPKKKTYATTLCPYSYPSYNAFPILMLPSCCLSFQKQSSLLFSFMPYVFHFCLSVLILAVLCFQPNEKSDTQKRRDFLEPTPNSNGIYFLYKVISREYVLVTFLVTTKEISDQYNLSVRGTHNRDLTVWGHNPSSGEGMVAVKWGSNSHCSQSADKGWWMLVFCMTSLFNSGMRPKPIKCNHPQSQINQEYIQGCLLKNATLYWTLVSFIESRIMLSAVTYIK